MQERAVETSSNRSNEIEALIFRLAQVVVGVGSLCAGALGGQLFEPTRHGVSVAIPFMGSLALMIVADSMWRRRYEGAAFGGLMRALAVAYGVGAATAAIAPIRALAGPENGALRAFHNVLCLVLVLAFARVLVLSAGLLLKLRRGAVRACALALGLSAAVCALVIIVGPPNSQRSATLLAGIIYIVVAASPAFFMSMTRRRNP